MTKFDRPRQCPQCGMIPVKSKTWSMLMKQDDLLSKMRAQIERLKEKLKEEVNARIVNENSES